MNFDPGHHTVQFYEREDSLAGSLAAFFGAGLRRGDPAIMISAPRTFALVTERLSSHQGGGRSRKDAARIHFVNAESALAQLMDSDGPDPVRYAREVGGLIGPLREQHRGAPIWVYGDMVDVLCKRHQHAAAVRLEELCNRLVPEFAPIVVLCGYSAASFDDDHEAQHLRSVCGQHTHIVPAYGFRGTRQRSEWEQMVLLQHRARASGRALERESQAQTARTHTVYLIDDDASVRRSLERLLSLRGFAVRSFASAEEFLAQIDATAQGCLLVDVNLEGMQGPELQSLLSNARWSLPIVAMSGSRDLRTEREALREGARAFLRKPFDSTALLEALAAARA